MISVVQRSQLLEAAHNAAQQAYAPYSKFLVGAALLTKKGNLFSGCNVENSSFGLTICAERVAIFSAIAKEGKDMKIFALAVVNQHNVECAPCGACRQVILEFGSDAIILFQSSKGIEETLLNEILPWGFCLDG
jgi:cytidine deaminase